MDLAPPPVSDEQLQRADADDRAPRPVDQMLHAAVGRLTGGLSLASLSAAYADWFAHLLGSPGKQQQLLEKAWRESVRLGLWGAMAEPWANIRCSEKLPASTCGCRGRADTLLSARLGSIMQSEQAT